MRQYSSLRKMDDSPTTLALYTDRTFYDNRKKHFEDPLTKVIKDLSGEEAGLWNHYYLPDPKNNLKETSGKEFVNLLLIGHGNILSDGLSTPDEQNEVTSEQLATLIKGLELKIRRIFLIGCGAAGKTAQLLSTQVIPGNPWIYAYLGELHEEKDTVELDWVSDIVSTLANEMVNGVEAVDLHFMDKNKNVPEKTQLKFKLLYWIQWRRDLKIEYPEAEYLMNQFEYEGMPIVLMKSPLSEI